jgi:uncharacterized protein YjiS (DUF1127 family)
MEAAMKISTEAAFSRNDQPSGRTGLNHVLSDWWQTLRLRHELESLDDGILRDIGLTPDEHRIEASKPFWMN